MKYCLSLVLTTVLVSHVSWARSRVQQHFLNSDTSPQADWMVSPMIGVFPFAAVEIGAKGSHEFVPDGFIEALNDSVSGEVSFFYGKYRGDTSSYFSGNMRWDFHLVPEWTVFGAPGLSVRHRDGEDNDGIPRVSFQVGGFWNIQPNLALRADIDVEDINPRVGVSFRL
jgi:hypothetical protein